MRKFLFYAKLCARIQSKSLMRAGGAQLAQRVFAHAEAPLMSPVKIRGATDHNIQWLRLIPSSCVAGFTRTMCSLCCCFCCWWWCVCETRAEGSTRLEKFPSLVSLADSICSILATPQTVHRLQNMHGKKQPKITAINPQIPRHHCTYYCIFDSPGRTNCMRTTLYVGWDV